MQLIASSKTTPSPMDLLSHSKQHRCKSRIMKIKCDPSKLACKRYSYHEKGTFSLATQPIALPTSIFAI
eukprot:1336519-Amphidinium_carterae.1